MESDIIKISHLTKNFGEVKAVNDLNFKVKRGELFAFLGVNGAGKSTTISIICGQLHKDSGSVEIDGVAAEKLGNKLGKKLGIVFQDSVEYSCAAEPPVQYRLSHLSRRSEPLINHTICYDASLLA